MSIAHIVLLIAINLGWGFNFIAGSLGTQEFGPLVFSVVRFAMVLVVLLPFLRSVPGQMVRVLMVGLLMGVGHYSIMFFALYIGESVSALAVAAQLSVPFSTLIAVVWLKEQVGWIRSLSIAVSFLGVVVIGFEPVGTDHWLAVGLASLAALSIALAANIMRQLQGVGVFQLQAWVALISTVSLGLIALVIEPERLRALPSLDWQAYWTPAYSGIVATLFGHGSLYYLLQRYPVNEVTPFVTLSSVFAVGFGVVLMGDMLTVRLLIGGLMTLLGVTIIARRNRS